MLLVRSLFNRCMDAIQDHMTAGILVDLDRLPPEFRQMIFVKFPSYNRPENRTANYPPPSIRRSEFFNNFKHIGMLKFGDCYQQKRLFPIILAEIERPGSSLASTLVSLSLRICLAEFCPISWFQPYRPGFQEKHTTVAPTIYRLIAACKNLRRLYLEKSSPCWNRPVSGSVYCLSYHRYKSTMLPIDWDNALVKIMDALATGGASRAPLQELTLCNFDSSDIRNEFSALESLQALHLLTCHLSLEKFLLLIKPCRNSLQTLGLERVNIDVYESFGMRYVDWLFQQRHLPGDVVDLPALTSLIVDRSHWYTDCWALQAHEYTMQLCSLSPGTLRGVRRGKVCLYNTSKNEMIQMLADSLPTEVEVALVFGRSLDIGWLSLALKLFGQRIVELHFDLLPGSFPTLTEYDKVIDQLTSIRVLVITGSFYFNGDDGVDQFLRRFLSDAHRGAQLRRLSIKWKLPAETLRLLFQHCVNLEWLEIRPVWNHRDELPAITDEHLKIWAAIGAKPKEIRFGCRTNITAEGVEHLLRNCGGDLKASYVDEIGRLKEFMGERGRLKEFVKH